MLTLGSLFDGVGTALLAASICGIKPVWSSEIEPFPMAVSEHHFPDVKQLGDVTKIKGAEIEPVDIIFFGSPCQDLSQAGLRKGLKHEENGDGETTRSGLFMEAVRIAKEMRKADEIRQLQMRGADDDFRPDPRPKFLCWENVPGALTSQSGADFQCVIEELAKIKDKTAHVPLPENGRWGDSGQVAGDGFSIAWRILDSQFFGVPQRRKRIFLVCSLSDNTEQAFRDSGMGSCAGEILFKRPGLRRNLKESRKAWEETSRPFEACTGAADSKVTEAVAFEGNGNRPSHHGDGYRNPGEPMYTLNTTEVHGVATQGGCHSTYAMTDETFFGVEEDKTPTLKARDYKAPMVVTVPMETIPNEPKVFENHSQDSRYTGPLDVTPTLASNLGTEGNNTPFVVEPKVYGICSYDSNSMKSSNPDSGFYEAETTRTLDLNGGNPSCNQGGMAVVQMVSGDPCPTLTVGDFDRMRYNNESLEKLIVEQFPMNPPEIEGGVQVMTMDTSWFDTSAEVSNTLKAHDANDPMCVVVPHTRE